MSSFSTKLKPAAKSSCLEYKYFKILTNMEINLYDHMFLEEKVQEKIEYAHNGWYTPGSSYYP